MDWLNIFGLIMIAVIMIPNIIFAIRCKEGFENKWSNKFIEVAEQIGRFGCFGFMIINIPGTWFGWWSDEAFAIYLIVDTILVVLYCAIWIFYDETGKRVRTKKEIADENGKIRVGCTVIPKGGVYEQHLFTVKDDRFKSEPFLDEVKRNYTDLINRHISDPEHRLKVFDPDSIYLPTKKIGKNNPKAAEIEADNAARQEWNRTADMALISGIEKTKILEIKKEEIHQKASQSIRTNGWLPNLFRNIVSKAKEFLQNLIRQTALPPKPILNMDMAEFRTMQKLMIRVQDRAREIRSLQDEVPKLKAQLAETKGIFKSKERKALETQIQQTEEKISAMLEVLPEILKVDGYSDVQAFMATYRKAETVVENYKRELAEWERNVKESRRPAEEERYAPPEKQSVRGQLRRLQAEGRQPKSKHRSHDRER